MMPYMKMLTKNLVLVLWVLCCFHAVGQKTPKFLKKDLMRKPVPLEIVNEFRRNLTQEIERNRERVNYQEQVSLPSSTILDYARKGVPYVMAVFGFDGRRITISLLPASRTGQLVGEKPAEYENIQNFNRQLRANVVKKVPFGLQKFPSAIKMETANLARIINQTGCRMVLFYPAIETESRKFTICAVGSDDEVNPHPRHLDADYRIAAEETWPETDFIYFVVEGW
jgi:hypothetical protein